MRRLKLQEKQRLLAGMLPKSPAPMDRGLSQTAAVTNGTKAYDIFNAGDPCELCELGRLAVRSLGRHALTLSPTITDDDFELPLPAFDFCLSSVFLFPLSINPQLLTSK